MHKHFVAVAPAELSTVWPQIRDEVSTIETPDGFIPEDVFTACKTNNSTLFFLMEGEKRVGWMVARLQLPDLHIWQLKADAEYDVMTTFRSQLMELARNAGATAITYGSTRKAWAKVAVQHGFKIRMIVYASPVDPDPAKIPGQLPPADAAVGNRELLSNSTEVAPQ